MRNDCQKCHLDNFNSLTCVKFITCSLWKLRIVWRFSLLSRDLKVEENPARCRWLADQDRNKGSDHESPKAWSGISKAQVTGTMGWMWCGTSGLLKHYETNPIYFMSITTYVEWMHCLWWRQNQLYFLYFFHLYFLLEMYKEKPNLNFCLLHTNQYNEPSLLETKSQPSLSKIKGPFIIAMLSCDTEHREVVQLTFGLQASLGLSMSLRVFVSMWLLPSFFLKTTCWSQFP